MNQSQDKPSNTTKPSEPEEEAREQLIHLLPAVGPKHALREGCWCWPEWANHDKTILVHNTMH